MPKPYPKLNITTSEGLYEYAYIVTDGYISVLFMAASLIILFAILKSRFYKTSDSVALSSFLTLIICSFIWALGYFPGRFLTLLIVLTIAGVIWGIFEK